MDRKNTYFYGGLCTYVYRLYWTSMEAWRNEFNCIICKEISVSPVQNCINGHITCGICFDKIKTCGLCQNDLVPCGFAERLLHNIEVNLPCRYSEDGCPEIIKATDMKNHITNACKFRSIPCCLLGQLNCNAKITGKDITNHLQEIHGVGMSTINGEIAITDYDEEAESVRMRVSPITFGGTVFLLHMAYKKDIYYFWASVIGDEEVAMNYRFLINSPLKRFTEDNNLNFVPEYSWKLPVVPYTESQFQQVHMKGQVAQIPFNVFLPFFQEEEFPFERQGQSVIEFRNSWTSVYEIIPVF